MFEAPHTVQSGETISLRAWSYLEFSANYADYLNLLAALRSGAGQAEPEPLQQSLLERVMAASVRANDLDLIAVADVPGILEAVFDLNRIEEMAAKPLGLHSRVVLAMESAQMKARETAAKQANAGTTAAG
jgi:hypothetical protein